MKLERGEHSILASFPSSIRAKEAVNALKEAGIEDVQLDRVSLYGVEANREYNNPLAGQADTLTGLTLFSADRDQLADDDARVLLGADPSVSGIGMTDYGVAGGKAFLVTVVTNGQKLNQALKIIENHGGKV
ncbi:hypothetical protein SY88_06870 [Clostridiales bacterium PH28_bin88]|nr:hypothetical protein SY88_06870 [Clostridiales bacterium PH28_bin88]